MYHGLRLYSHQARCGRFLTNETVLTKVVELERRILETVKEIRSDDLRIGADKLWLILINMYDRHHVSGRNRFFAILRRKGLMLLKAFVIHGITAPFPMQNIHNLAGLSQKHINITITRFKPDQPNLSTHTIDTDTHVARVLSHNDAITFV